MKKLLFVLLVMTACGGRLSDEERKKLHEGMSTLDIKRISDADLHFAAVAYAQSVLKEIEKGGPDTESVAASFKVKIVRLAPSDSALREIEKQLVDAYVTGGNAQNAGENLQKLGEDSLLFTKPLFKTSADGSQQFDYAIGIKMATKTVVLSMPKP